MMKKTNIPTLSVSGIDGGGWDNWYGVGSEYQRDDAKWRVWSAAKLMINEDFQYGVDGTFGTIPFICLGRYLVPRLGT